MTDTDTTPLVVRRLPGPDHPARGRGSPPIAEEGPPGLDTPVADAAVVPLNDAAAMYEALAAEIEGTAVGWSAGALAQLEQGLLQRYGPLIGGRHPVRRLVRLAARPVSR